MAKRRKKSRKTSHHVINLSSVLVVLVALTAWAHSQGLINWELPASLAAAPTSSSTDAPSISEPSEGTSVATPAALGTVAGASPDNCAPQFLAGQAPVLTNDKMKAKTQTLCYQGFAVSNSGLTRTPLWAAEHLTADRIAKARDLPRTDSFHADLNLPKDERAELADYKGSAFDRGHMAPNGDMPDVKSQAECFTLANIVPQNPENNRGIWKEIEEKVRDLAANDADIYVVSGPIFSGDNIEQLHDRVMVPTQFFKAVYDARQRKGAAYIVDNRPGNTYETISLTKLQSVTGLNVFPGMTPAAIGQLALPAPSEKRPG